MARQWIYGIVAAALGAVAVPHVAFASGSLAIQPNYFPLQDRVGGQVGLYIYEPISGPLSYDSWSGVGSDFNGQGWNSTNHNISYSVKRFQFSLGVGVNLGQKFNQFNPNVHGRVQIRLWD